MKHLLACTMLCAPSIALADTFYTNLPVESATIYPQGALVLRKTRLDMPAGVHQVVMALHPSVAQNGSAKLDVLNAQTQSIQINRDFLGDVSVYYTDAQRAVVAAFEASRDVLAELNREDAQLRLNLSGLIAQATYLQQIRPSGETPQTIEQLQAVVSFLPTALAENATSRRDVQAQIDALAADIQTAEADFRKRKIAYDLANLPSENSIFATATINVENPGLIDIIGQNFTGQAGWAMRYDVTLLADETSVSLDRVANISQSTSEAWDDVKIVLSSAKPFQQLAPRVPGRDVVELLKLTLNKSLSRSVSLEYDSSAPIMEAMAIADDMGASGGAITGSFDGVAVEYPLPARVSLTGQFGTAEQVELSTLDLDADTDRYASPRRDMTAFVRAKITNTTGEPILSGSANYYRGENLINSSHINLVVNGADETLYFGPDDSLPLTMQFLSELSGDTGFISRSNTRTEEMAFQIENIASAAKTVTIVYNLPISVEEEVDVTVNARPRPTRTQVDGVQGRAEWDLTLNPGEKQQFTLDVGVAWPDDAQISWEP